VIDKNEIPLLELQSALTWAGNILLDYWPPRSAINLQAKSKSDGSPVTDADLKSQELLVEAIGALFPGDAIFSEESMPSERESIPDTAWFIDPLDGTRPFIGGQDHFAVFVGHMTDNVPDLGLLYYPAREDMYTGILGRGATRNGHSLRARTGADVRASSIVRQFTKTPFPAEYLSGTEYLTRNLAYLDLCDGNLDGVISGYSGGYVELYDVCAVLAVIAAAGLVASNHNGTSPTCSEGRLHTNGLLVTRPERLGRLVELLA
jgi:fructose-1,6-bisphosphatase/inositol monophosphatase family enzyme